MPGIALFVAGRASSSRRTGYKTLLYEGHWARRSRRGSSTASGTASGSRCTRIRAWVSRRVRRSSPEMSSRVEPGLYRPGLRRLPARGSLLVTEDGAENLTDFPYDLDSMISEPRSTCDRDDAPRGAPLSAAPGVRRAGERAARDLRPRLRGVLGAGGPRARDVVRAVHRSSTSGSRRTRSGTSAASSTSASTASTGTSRPAAAARSPTTGRASPRTTGATITFADLQREVVAARERAQGSSASARGRRSGSTWAWCPRSRSRCSPAPGSARRTRSSSAASRPTRSSGRLNDMGCEVLITQDEAWRKGSRCR